MTTAANTCPISPTRDDRKSAALADAEARPEHGFAPIRDYELARDIMRSPAMHQGMETDYFKDKEPGKVPVIFLDGELTQGGGPSSRAILRPRPSTIVTAR